MRARWRRALGIRQVLVPAVPGALSALGILDADLRREFSRTVMLAPGSSADCAESSQNWKLKRATTFRREGVVPLLYARGRSPLPGPGLRVAR